MGTACGLKFWPPPVLIVPQSDIAWLLLNWQRLFTTWATVYLIVSKLSLGLAVLSSPPTLYRRNACQMAPFDTTTVVILLF